jgi:hypothetical protein
MTIDFKITTWERCIVSDEDAEEILELIRNGKIISSADLFNYCEPDFEQMIEVEEPMVPEENGGNATIEVCEDKNMSLIWDNSINKE